MEKVIEESRLNLIYMNLIQTILSNSHHHHQIIFNQEQQPLGTDLIDFLTHSTQSNLIQNLIHSLLNSTLFSITQENSSTKEIENYLFKLDFVHQVVYKSFLNRSKPSRCWKDYHLDRFVDHCTIHHHPIHQLDQSLVDLVIHAALCNARNITSSKPNPNQNQISIRFLDRVERLFNSFDEHQFNPIEECSILWTLAKVFPFLSIREVHQSINLSNQIKLMKMCSKIVEEIFTTINSHDQDQDNQEAHPLFKSLGPISITLGILLRSIGPSHPLDIQTCLNSLPRHLTTSLKKPMRFSVLGILIGPVYLKEARLDLLMVCLKLWMKVFHGSSGVRGRRMGGKSELEGLVWEGISGGIHGLDGQEVWSLVRWLEPCRPGQDANGSSEVLVYLSVLELVMERIDGSYLDHHVLEKLWEEVEKHRGWEDLRKKDEGDDDEDRFEFQSAWRVLISIIKYRKLDGEEVNRFVERMMDLVLSSNHQSNHEGSECLETQRLENESLEVMIKTLEESMIWDHVICRLSNGSQYRKLIEVLNYVEHSGEFVKVCEVLKGLVGGIGSDVERWRAMELWFEVVGRGRFVEGVRWWIDQFGTGTGTRTRRRDVEGIGIGKGLAKL